MKRFVIGTALWLPIVAAVTVIGLRWSAVFGRRAEIELRMGVGRGERERRLYAAEVWKRAAKAESENAVVGSDFDVVKVEERV